MANAQKTAAVAELAAAFRSASATLLTEYRGLTVSEITALRRALGGGTQYAVVKNTLTKIAAAEVGVAGLDELLVGPTAIAFITGDPVEAAKGLRDFARTHPRLIVKGGVLEGRPVSATEIAKFAELESREVLLSKLAGAMKGSLSQAVALFAAPLAQVARLAAALEAKVAAEAPAPAAEAETSVPPSAEPAGEPPAQASASTAAEPAGEPETDAPTAIDPEPPAAADTEHNDSSEEPADPPAEPSTD